MKFLLRSTFVVAPGDDRELLHRNYLALSDSQLSFDVTEDSTVWTFVQDFVRSHNHVPDLSTVKGHFIRAGESEVVDRIGVLSSLPGSFRGDFIKRLEDKAHDRRVRLVQDVLRDAATVLTTGAEIRSGKETKLHKGPIDALRLVMDRSHDIVAPTIGTRGSGEITSDGAAFVEHYISVRSDPLAGIGQFTGIQQMDLALKGAKRKELWIHAGFTAHGKSLFMFNWAYNQAVYYKHDVLIFSLEMYYDQVRNLLFAIHSHHEKFKEIRFKLGIQSDEYDSVGLPYEAIRDGLLHTWHPKAEEFLFKHVVPDFENPANYYGKIHIEVPDPEKSDFTVADLRAKSELIYSKTPFAMLFVDHAGLMSPRKWVASTTERLNEVFRSLKQLAMSFNRGQGMAVVTLFQINREGFKAAQKAQEKTGRASYDLTSLSYANESERSADIVTVVWADDAMKKSNRALYMCLKTRDTQGFEPFLARIEWPCRRVLTCFDLPPTSAAPANPQTASQKAETAARVSEELEGLGNA